MNRFSLWRSFFPWQNTWMHLKHYGVALIIFLFGLFLSFAAFKFYQKQALDRTHIEFDRMADLRLSLIKQALLGTLEQMESIKQFYYSSEEVTEKEFHIFVHNSFYFSHSMLAFGWILAHQTETPIKSSIGLEFSESRHPDSSRFFRFTYFESANPFQPFTLAGSDYKKFVALLQKSSRNSSTISVSDTFDFFQKKKKRKGFFLFKPIFFEEMEYPGGKKGLFGTIVGFSNFEGIINGTRSKIEKLNIDFGIYDITDGKEKLLYWSPSDHINNASEVSLHEHQLQQQWSLSDILKFGDRTWKLIASPTKEVLLQSQKQWNYWEIPIIGFLISCLIASYFLVLVNQRMLIEKQVQKRTSEMATINNMLQKEIQERQKIEKEIAQQQRDLQRRHEAVEYLTKLTIHELRSAIHEVILRTATVMQVERVSVWLYEPSGQTQVLSCAGLYLLSTHSFSDHLEFISSYFPHYFKALLQQSHLILPSFQDSELNRELSSYLAAFHIISKLDIPIVFEGSLLGVLSLEETRGQREWRLEDRHFGQTIADIIAIMIEQSAKRKAEKALHESEERLYFITQKSIDGIISVNDRLEIISWNFGAEKMFGYQEKEMIGKPLQEVFPQIDSFLNEKISTKPIELKGQHLDGHLFPVEISHTRWESADYLFDTIIVRDITERKEYEKRLIQAMHEAKAANEAKSEFLAMFSHELRTPLNAIIGFNECLLMEMDGPINEAQYMSLKRIEKSSFHLLTLISDILDLAKIETHKMQLEFKPYNIVDIVASSVEEMQSLAKQKKLDLFLSIDKPFILVEIDKVRIRQVLLNLLSNAIKFTEKGSITVTIHNEPERVSIAVTDTGIGLTPEEIAKLFRPFSQADSSITRKYGGTGLGLVISKKIIDLHKGTITVKSQKGHGSSFTFTLHKITQ